MPEEQHTPMIESDPHNRPLNTPGAKADAGKVRPALVLGGFARAVLAVSEVATYGASKYTEDGWRSVPRALARYRDAGDRHRLAGELEDTDPESGLLHLAHEAWNVLALLEITLARKEQSENDRRKGEWK